MKLHILKIILWPKDEAKAPRIIPFDPSGVSVITGQSETGKSSIVAIIDYCLGSGKCAIPVGVIRQKTAWFGLHLQLEDSQMIVARKEPGQQIQSSDYFILEGLNLNVPPQPFKNGTSDSIISRFARMAGLGETPLGDPTRSGFQGPVSFRDFAAFNFLPQHIVANPHTLFFKADTYEHQQKLREVFPLALGAITPQTLAAKARLKDLREDQRKLQALIDERRAASNAWGAEVRANYSRAREYGLMPSAPLPQPSWSVEDYLIRLKEVPKFVAGSVPKPERGAIERGVAELNELLAEEESLSRDLSTARLRLSKLESVSDTSSGFGSALKSQSRRLEAVGWYASKVQSSHSCPFCEQYSEKAADRLKELSEIAARISEHSFEFANIGEVLDKEVLSARRNLQNLEDRLVAVREHRKILEEESDSARASRFRMEEIYRFIGRVEQAINNIEAVSDDGSLQGRLIRVENEIRSLESDPSIRGEAGRLQNAKDQISRLINAYLQILKSDRANDVVSLDIPSLLITILSQDGRKDYLWEIGSGANWMAFHIATFLAIHRFLLSLESSVVPSFLVIDQPSQVYFPESWPGDPKSKKSVESIDEYSEDIKGVHRVFEVLSTAIQQLKGALQIIVVDHAGEITWQDVPNVKEIERWRGEADFLIPRSWLP